MSNTSATQASAHSPSTEATRAVAHYVAQSCCTVRRAFQNELHLKVGDYEHRTVFICAVLKHHSCRGPRGQDFSYIGNGEFVQYTSHSFSLGHSSPCVQHIGSATLVQCMSAALHLRASEDSNNTCNGAFTQHSRNTIGGSYSEQANRAFPPCRPHPQKLRDS